MDKKPNDTNGNAQKNVLPLLIFFNLCLTLILAVLVIFMLIRTTDNAPKNKDYVTREQFNETVSGLVNDFGDIIRSQQERLDILESAVK